MKAMCPKCLESSSLVRMANVYFSRIYL